MTDSSSQPRRSITDSPWYWMHLFCVASLVALVLVGPRFAQRQAGVERKFQGRQRASQNKSGEPPRTPMSTAENRHVKLLPLYLLVGAGAIISWIALWLTRMRPQRPTRHRRAIVQGWRDGEAQAAVPDPSPDARAASPPPPAEEDRS